MLDAYRHKHGFRCILPDLTLLAFGNPFHVSCQKNYASPSFMAWGVRRRIERRVHSLTPIFPSPIRIYLVWAQTVELLLQLLELGDHRSPQLPLIPWGWEDWSHAPMYSLYGSTPPCLSKFLSSAHE